MVTYVVTTTLFLFLAMAITTLCLQEIEVLQMAQNHVSQAKNLIGNSLRLHGLGSLSLSDQTSATIALSESANVTLISMFPFYVFISFIPFLYFSLFVVDKGVSLCSYVFLNLR